jgi:hypothetical protein
MGLDLNTVMQVAELAAAFETGGASLALQEAEQQAVQQVAQQAFQGALSQMGSSNQSQMLDSFAAGYGAATGLSSSGGSSQSQAVLDAAYRSGGLQQSSQNLQSQMANLIDELGAQGQQTDGSSGSGSSNGSGGAAGNNWMEAIARAMGEALGELSQKVVDESNELSSEAGNSSSSGAQQFQSTMAEFQADSQTLSMLSNAFATAIKSIGEGMQTMASKQ